MKSTIDFVRSAEKSKNFHILAAVLGIVIRECSIISMALSELDILSTWLYIITTCGLTIQSCHTTELKHGNPLMVHIGGITKNQYTVQH